MDLRYFELGVKGSSRFFLELGDRGRAARQQLSDRQHTLAVEISRHFASPSGAYGRLGLEVLQFLPDTRKWIHLAVDTGLMPSAILPWNFQLGLHYFASAYGEGNFLTARLHTAKQFTTWPSGSLDFGGFFSWTRRAREVGKAVGDPAVSFEHMLFSMGPYFDLKSASGRLTVCAPLRLWLDKELFDRAGVIVTAYPSEVTQDLTVTYSLLF